MEMNFTNIITSLLATLLPVLIIFLNKENVLETKKGIIWSIVSGISGFLITLLVLVITKTEIILTTTLTVVLLSTLFNYLVMTGKCNLKKLPKTLVVITLFFCFSLVQLIPIWIFNISVKEMSATTNALLTIFSDILLLITLVCIYYKDLKQEFIAFKNNFNEYMDIALKYWIIGLIVMMVSNLAINFFSPKSVAGNEESIRVLIKSAPFLTWIATSLLAPTIEELVFRKAFKDFFKTKWVFILASGVIFGGLHVILSFKSIYDLLYLIPYCSLGIAFAYIYQKTESIFASIAMHTLHNAIVTGITIVSYMVML